jgi:hypothetical protein
MLGGRLSPLVREPVAEFCSARMDGIQMSFLLRAVVIGVNEYIDRRLSNLLFARKDAIEIYNVLQTSTAFRLEAEHSCVLLNAEATECSVRAALDHLFAQRSFESRTINLLYFAGHGIHWRHDDLTYLCCHDVDVANPRYRGVCLSDIYKWFTSSSAECVIAIIDACFSGGLVVSPQIDYWSPAERARQAIEVQRGPDGKTAAFLAACSSNGQTRENERYRHGVYTYHLLRGWRGGGARDDDGIVRLTGLINYMERTLEQGWQKPASSIRGSGSIPLWQAARPASAPGAPQPPIPGLLPGTPLTSLSDPVPVSPVLPVADAIAQNRTALLSGELSMPPGALSPSSLSVPSHPRAAGDVARTRSGFLLPPQATVPLHPDVLGQRTKVLEQPGDRAGLPPAWKPGPLARTFPRIVLATLVALAIILLILRLVHP